MAKLLDKAKTEMNPFFGFNSFFSKENADRLKDQTDLLKENGISTITKTYKDGEAKFTVKRDGEKKCEKLTEAEFSEKYPAIVENENHWKSIISAASADDDNVLTMIKNLSEPTTRKEMSWRYEDYLGYDPTTYFDHAEISDKVKEFQKEYPDINDGVVNLITLQSCQIYDNNREGNHNAAIKAAIRVLTDNDEIESSVEQKFAEKYSYLFEDEDIDDIDISTALDDIEDDDDIFSEDSESDDDFDSDDED